MLTEAPIVVVALYIRWPVQVITQWTQGMENTHAFYCYRVRAFLIIIR